MRVYEPAVGRVKETRDLADTMRFGSMLALSVSGALDSRGVCYVRKPSLSDLNRSAAR